MATSISISREEHFEVICAGLRLLEERAANSDTLRQALVDGESSGDAGPYCIEDIKAKRVASSSQAADRQAIAYSASRRSLTDESCRG